jgi:hypothetical protein
MAFDHDEGNPTDGSYIADFPTNERLHRTAVLNSLLVDHDTENDGHHKKVSLDVLGAKPSTVGTTGFVYTKVEDGQTELFWLDDTDAEVQLSDKGSASPDKVAIAGDTMTGVLVIEAAASAIHLENLGAKIMGRDVGDANWRALLSVDDSDVCELGDASLDGGTRLVSDGEDALVAKYPGETDKKIWHAGHFAAAPLATVLYESTGVNITWEGATSIKYTIAHGLAAMPTLWNAVLQCTVNDGVYSVGEEVQIVSTWVAGSTPQAITCAVDASDFIYRLSDSKPNLLTDTGNSANISNDKWDIIFRAWYTE